MNNWSLNDKIYSVFGALAGNASHHCLPAWTTDKFGSHQWLIEEMEHNISVIQAQSITGLIMHVQMDVIVLWKIFVLPCQRIQWKRFRICVAYFSKTSTQMVWTQRWHSLTMMRADGKRCSLITSRRNWYCSWTICVVMSAALLLLRMVAYNIQLDCYWAGLQSPAAASPSAAASRTAKWQHCQQHQHHQHCQHRISHWKEDNGVCDTAWRQRMVSVIRFRISIWWNVFLDCSDISKCL